jgi:hypothetical protein
MMAVTPIILSHDRVSEPSKLDGLTDSDSELSVPLAVSESAPGPSSWTLIHRAGGGFRGGPCGPGPRTRWRRRSRAPGRRQNLKS